MADGELSAQLTVSAPMSTVFIGRDARAAGFVTRSDLARKYRRVLPDVYGPKAELPLADRTIAAWLWSRRRAVVTGQAAAALHGAKWVDAATPIELNFANNKCPPGIVARRETLLADEVQTRDSGMALTTVPRTAFDLARRGPARHAIARLDALAQARPFDADEVLALARRHPHVDGLPRVHRILAQVDGGAQSPQETYLRLTLIDAGFPRPQTQIPVPGPNGRWYYLDMGWSELKVAVEYDGEQHRTDRSSYFNDVIRLEYLAAAGWIIVRVLADHRRGDIVERVRRARESRLGYESA